MGFAHAGDSMGPLNPICLYFPHMEVGFAILFSMMWLCCRFSAKGVRSFAGQSHPKARLRPAKPPEDTNQKNMES